MATEIGIKEVRNLTSGQIRAMKPSDEIVITDRGEPIATIRPLTAPSDASLFLDDLRQARRGDSGAFDELMESKTESIAAQQPTG
jgi:antitoxin (DNA-binding transcriptional repressor) of toxin-antitoxin stability system